jgi:DNA repair exonuclease SbcCD ATPase subunit
MKVAEPQVLARLQSELLKPVVAGYVVKSVEKEVRKALAAAKTDKPSTQRQLDEERRKLQNLIAAIEGGSDAPAALLKAMKEREAAIKRLESQLKRELPKPVATKAPDLAPWVREQLQNLTALLKTDPVKVKSEFRRLNLNLTFNPIEAKPRPHFVVKGQCDLSALVFLFLRRRFQSAVLDRLRERSGR